MPTLDEAGVTGYEANTWQMMVGPAHMPGADRGQAQRARSPISCVTPEAQTAFHLARHAADDRHAGARRRTTSVKEAARWTQIIKGMGISID